MLLFVGLVNISSATLHNTLGIEAGGISFKMLFNRLESVVTFAFIHSINGFQTRFLFFYDIDTEKT